MTNKRSRVDVALCEDLAVDGVLARDDGNTVILLRADLPAATCTDLVAEMLAARSAAARGGAMDRVLGQGGLS